MSNDKITDNVEPHDVEAFFEEIKGITVEAARQAGAKYTAIDICRFAQRYHDRKMSQQAQVN